jgi:hypothetical protein
MIPLSPGTFQGYQNHPLVYVWDSSFEIRIGRVFCRETSLDSFKPDTGSLRNQKRSRNRLIQRSENRRIRARQLMMSDTKGDEYIHIQKMLMGSS